MFKLDLFTIGDAIARCHDVPMSEKADAACEDLSRQIKEAGGPDGDLETQLRVFFAKDARIRELEAQLAAFGPTRPPPPPPPPGLVAGLCCGMPGCLCVACRNGQGGTE